MTKSLDLQVADIARTFLGVPFHHQGRVNSGLDCVGLVVLSHKLAGYTLEDYITYSRSPRTNTLLDHVKQNAFKVPLEESKEGDMVLFYLEKPNRKKLLQHMGILARKGETVIHTWSQVARNTSVESGKVVESSLAGQWLKNLHSTWRVFPWRRSH